MSNTLLVNPNGGTATLGSMATVTNFPAKPKSCVKICSAMWK